MDRRLLAGVAAWAGLGAAFLGVVGWTLVSSPDLVDGLLSWGREEQESTPAPEAAATQPPPTGTPPAPAPPTEGLPPEPPPVDPAAPHDPTLGAILSSSTTASGVDAEVALDAPLPAPDATLELDTQLRVEVGGSDDPPLVDEEPLGDLPLVDDVVDVIGGDDPAPADEPLLRIEADAEVRTGIADADVDAEGTVDAEEDAVTMETALAAELDADAADLVEPVQEATTDLAGAALGERS